MMSDVIVPSSTDSIRLTLMGDLHFYRLWVAPWRLLSKRILGQINLWWDRRHSFDRSLLAPMLQRVLTIDPALLLLTGDMTMTSLREEFEDVAALLRSLDGRVPMIGVPGNHDRYTPFSRRRRIMEKLMPGLVPEAFPHMRSLSPRWKLMVLDAAMPRLLSARGAVGEAQLAAMKDELATLSREQGVIIMCHYPAISKPDGKRTGWNHRLIDAEKVLDVLRGCKASIIYAHGHVHWPWLVRGPQGISNMIDLNVGAPIMKKAQYVHGQGLWQLDLPENSGTNAKFTHHVPVSTGRSEQGLVTLNWDARVVQ